MKYPALFVLIQLLQVPLFLLGVPVCFVLALFEAWHGEMCAVEYSASYKKMIAVWPWPFWVWSNDEDGVLPPAWYRPGQSDRLRSFIWTAFRNSVNNYRFVPGVSGAGRPLYYRNFAVGSKEFYFKAGWAPKYGWPMLSFGAGRGY